MISVNYKLDFGAEKSDDNLLKSNIIRFFYWVLILYTRDNICEKFDKALVCRVMFYIVIRIFFTISPYLSTLFAFFPLIISLFFIYIERNTFKNAWINKIFLYFIMKIFTAKSKIICFNSSSMAIFQIKQA